MNRYFGTDGVRGRVGQSPMTPDFVLRLGWAAGRVLASTGRKRVLIGKDTRLSGYMFESALEAGLSAAGVDVRLLGPMPTPAVAYLTRSLRASAGIVISASHNPFHDNGVKFFSADGEKLPDEVEAAIEALLDEPLQLTAPDALGKAQRVDDAAGRYIEFCKSTVPLGLSFAGLKVVVDCAHGATYHIAPRVLRELGAEVHAIGVDPDGLNINEGCGSTSPALLRETVRQVGADLGLALDGDGDRVVMVDADGRLIDGDAILYALVRERVETTGYAGGVVGTLMSNFGLEQAVTALGLPFLRAKVGDRYVMEQLRRTGWLYGGEASGHILCLDRTSTGDGIVAALQVMAAMKRTGLSLAQLCSGLKVYPQVMINVAIQERVDLSSLPDVVRVVEGVEAALAGRGRVVLRPSGTEPLVRVMVEGEDAGEVEGLAERIALVVRDATRPEVHRAG